MPSLPEFLDAAGAVGRVEIDRSFARGIYLFILGLAKKVLLADTFALVANYGFAQTFSLDSISTVAVDQQALHSSPGHISPGRPVPEAAEQKNDESIQ